MSDRDTTAGIASPPPQDGGLRFIPFRRRDIVSMCLHHGGLDTAQAQQHFATAKAVIQTHFQQEFHAIKQQLKDAYAPLDPDADTRSIPLTATPGGPGATGSPEPGLMETLERVLDRANYEKVSGQTLRQALRTASLFQLRLYIDLDDYDEVLLYTRGATRREETLREFFGLWRRTVRFTNFDRVLLYIRARPDLDGDGAVGQLQPGSTVLKLFQNVPEADLEMLFPNIRIGMRPLDKLMITVPALISGGAVITTKTGATLLLLGSLVGFWLGLSHEPVELDKKTVIVLLAGMGALLGYVWKQFASFRNRKLRYTQALTENLYFKLLDNNAGAMYRILDDAEESECKESLLAYCFLLAAGEPLSAAALDARIEQWFAERWQCRLNFDIADALDKLQRLHLASREGQCWRALTVGE